MILGCHLSIASLEEMSKTALSLETNTFQFFLRSPQAMNSKKKIFNDTDIKKLNELKISNPLAHAPFVANAASSKEFVRNRAIEIIKEDLESLNNINNSLYVFHPGAHVGDGIDIGIDRIINMLNKNLIKEQNTIILLETMTGKGTEIGGKFEDLAKIISAVNIKESIGVCLDTCHIWDAGYDIENNLEEVIEEFDDIIGLNYLKAIHLNNSLNDRGSKKDRHANLYNGKISIEAFENIINHEKLKNLPFYLETPVNTISDYKKDIELIKKIKH